MSNQSNHQRADEVAMAGSAARFISPEVLSRISSLELLARAVVEGFIAGLHRSPFTGFSTEFAEYRQYMPGDDLRHLDWKLLGRTDRYFIKKYRGDTNTQCHIILDISASMDYSTGAVTKLQYGQFLTAALSYLVNQQQDAIGLILFDDEVRLHIPARSRSGHMRTIFGNLAQLKPGRETRVANLLHQTADRLTRRGIVVVISDFYDEPAAITKGLQHLRFKGNDVIVFHLLDRNELEFNFFDPVLLEDNETTEQINVIPQVIADGYREAIGDHIRQLKEAAGANWIEYLQLVTDQPLDQALFSFLSKRQR